MSTQSTATRPTNSMTMRCEVIHVVDDDDNYRKGLELLLRAIGFQVEVYRSAEHFLAIYKPRDVECLILDLRMPGMTGLALQRELTARRIRLPILIVSAFAETPSVVQAVQNGAFDFLEKPIEELALIAKVETALRHDRKAKMTSGDLNARLARLTDRERDVLNLLVDARTTFQAARELGISPKTIEKHRIGIFGKLSVSSVPELINLLKDR